VNHPNTAQRKLMVLINASCPFLASTSAVTSLSLRKASGSEKRFTQLRKNMFVSSLCFVYLLKPVLSNYSNISLKLVLSPSLSWSPLLFAFRFHFPFPLSPST
jgi:hypothetical protein